MSIQVVNAKADMSMIHRGEYVGRKGWNARFRRSPLANPFKIGRDGDRADVIARYGQWLRDRIQLGDRDVLDELARLASIVVKTGTLTLVCWCAPLDCHAEVIKGALEEVLRTEEVA